ncbi:MAG: hypothetical protein JWM32_967 [Verrucomicrobia bacterium]|nr:hypothetical protein [Verrucomicrobiota bacterium]
MSPEILSSPTVEYSPVGEVRRIIRRICLLRAVGRAPEAARLELNELASASVHLPGLGGESVEAIFSEEMSRVTDASLVAELMAPLLAQSLGPLLRTSNVGSTAPPIATRTPSAAPPANGSPPSIADFIDGMLAQERPA